MKDDKKESYLELLLEPVIMSSNYMGDDRRPLAEMTAPRRLREGVPFEMRRCPYPRSRLGKPMNLSALRVLSLGMKQCINDTIRLRRAYFEYANISEWDLNHFWRFTRALDSLPAYLVRRAEGALDQDNLPGRVSTMFKAAQGLHLAPEILVIEGVPWDQKVTTHDLMELIESRNLFIDDGRACAGPPIMVEKFVDSAVSGGGFDQDDDYMFEVLQEKRAAGLFDYSDAVTNVFLSKMAYEVESRLALKKVLNDFDRPALRKIAASSTQRFGFYRSTKSEELEAMSVKIQAALRELPTKCEPVRDVPERFLSLLELRNSEKDSTLVKKGAALLWSALAEDERWFTRFEHLQEVVLKKLGREAPPQLSSRDFSGMGYTVREVLAEWLNVTVVHGSGKCVVQAGSTIETFSN